MPLSGTVNRKFTGKRADAGSIPAQSGTSVRKFTGKRPEVGALPGHTGTVVRKVLWKRPQVGSLPEQVGSVIRKYSTKRPIAGDMELGLGPELFTNNGFETRTGTDDDGIADTFTGWTTNSALATVVESITAVTLSLRAGTDGVRCVKCAGGGFSAGRITKAIAVDDYGRYRLSFWTRGDGTHGSLWEVRKYSQLDLIASGNTGVTGTDWTYVEVDLDLPEITGAISVNFKQDGTAGFCCFDDTSFKVRGGGEVDRKFTGTRFQSGSLTAQSGVILRKLFAKRSASGSAGFSGIVQAIKSVTRTLVALAGSLAWGGGVLARKIAYHRPESGLLIMTGSSIRKFRGKRALAGLAGFSASVARKVAYFRSLLGSLDFLGTVIGEILHIGALITEAAAGALSFGGELVRRVFYYRTETGVLTEGDSSYDPIINGDNELDKTTFPAGDYEGDYDLHATSAQSSEQSKSGIYSTKVTLNGHGPFGDGYRVFWSTSLISIPPGVCKILVSVYLPSGQIADTIYIEGQGGGVNVTYSEITTTDEWVDIEQDLTVETQFMLQFKLQDTSGWESNTSYFYFDNLSITTEVKSTFVGEIVRKYTGLRVLSGNLDFSKSIQRGVLYFRVLSGNLDFSKSIQRGVLYFRGVTGNLEFSKSIHRGVLYFRVLSGNLEFSKSIHRGVLYFRGVTGSLDLLGSIKRSVLYFRGLSGSLSFSGLVNSVIKSITDFMIYVWKRIS